MSVTIPIELPALKIDNIVSTNNTLNKHRRKGFTFLTGCCVTLIGQCDVWSSSDALIDVGNGVGVRTISTMATERLTRIM